MAGSLAAQVAPQSANKIETPNSMKQNRRIAPPVRD
jgi:hypothetical protein